MLEINTKDRRQVKKVLLDGYTYSVRKPGAGESVFLKEAGAEITKLEKKKEPTAKQKQRLEDLSSEALRISVALFDALGNKKAQDNLNTYDAMLLFDILGEVYGIESKPSQAAEPNA